MHSFEGRERQQWRSLTRRYMTKHEPILPTLQESAMTHLNILLATQDLSLLSQLMSTKRKDTLKRVKEIMSMPV